MSDLRKKIIKLAYEKPELRDRLLPLVTSNLRFAGNVPTLKELLDNYKINNPDTDDEGKVTLRTLKNKDKDSGAYKAYEKAHEEWKRKWEEEHGEPPPEEEDDEDDEGESDEDSEESEEDKDAKEKAKDVLEDGKDGIKSTWENFKEGEGSFDDIVDMMGALLLTFFDPSSGQEQLKEILEGMETEDEEAVKEGLSEVKAAEFAATLSDDANKALKENVGIDAASGNIDQDKFREFFEGDSNDMPDGLADELVESFGTITDKHIEFLSEFVDDDGKFDLKGLQKKIRKGVPEALMDMDTNGDGVADVEEIVERPGKFKDKTKKLENLSGSLLNKNVGNKYDAFRHFGKELTETDLGDKLQDEISEWVNTEVKDFPEKTQKRILKQLGDPKNNVDNVERFLAKPARDYQDAEIARGHFAWATARQHQDDKTTEFDPSQWMSDEKVKKYKSLQPLISKRDNLQSKLKKLNGKLNSFVVGNEYLTSDKAKLEEGIKEVKDRLENTLESGYSQKSLQEKAKKKADETIAKMKEYHGLANELKEIQKEIKEAREDGASEDKEKKKSSSLRTRTIQAAYSNKHLRPYLLPLILKND